MVGVYGIFDAFACVAKALVDVFKEGVFFLKFERVLLGHHTLPQSCQDIKTLPSSHFSNLVLLQ